MMDDMIDYGYAATSASILSEYPTATLHESSIPWNYCHIFLDATAPFLQRHVVLSQL